MKLLPEFRSKYTAAYGEDLLRRLGQTLDYEQIVNLHITQRCLSRHAGAARGYIDTVAEEEEEVDVDDVAEVVSKKYI